MSKIKKSKLFSPLINLLLFGLLLVATPFLMLQSYLQETVLGLSSLKLTLFHIDIKFLPIAFIFVFLVIMYVIIKNFSITRLIFILVCI